MFRKLFIIAATTAVMGGIAGPAMAAAAPAHDTDAASSVSRSLVDTTMHANTVTLENLDVGSMSFTPSGDYSISPGQPWGGVTSQTSGGTMTITAQAGRHDSSGPAQWFSQNVSAMVGGAAYSSSPSELNFAFSGTLTLDGTDYPIVIGQGSNAAGNNWWIGGSGWIQDGDGTIVSPDQEYVIDDAADAGGMSENTFTVSAADN